MRVAVDMKDTKTLGPNVYWRGTAFDTFDGRYWEKSETKGQPIRSMGGRFILDAKPTGEVIHQEYYVESTDSRVLFVLPSPSVITGPFPNLSVDPYGTVEMPSAINDKTHYTVDSVIDATRTPGPAGGGGSLSDREMTAYRQIPDNLDPRIPPLVSEIVGDETSPLKKAGLIRDWLLAHMSYDLNPKVMGKDPLSVFLFEEKRGYCEHFATAMVVMARVAGVPSRIVTGFLSGTYNDMGSFYIVRSGDAHAWVEVYTETKGWVPFEATPAAGLSGSAGTSVVRQVFENIIMLWTGYGVNYELGDQIKIIEGVRDIRGKTLKDISNTGLDTRRFLAGVRERRGAFFIPAVIAASILSLLLFGYIVRVFVLARLAPAVKGGEVGRIYRLAVDRLTKKGVRKAESTTPREFSKIAADRYPDIRADITALTELYYRQRFGHGTSGEEGAESARRLLTQIERGVR